jgi:hypothetical protein
VKKNETSFEIFGDNLFVENEYSKNKRSFGTNMVNLLVNYNN